MLKPNSFYIGYNGLYHLIKPYKHRWIMVRLHWGPETWCAKEDQHMERIIRDLGLKRISKSDIKYEFGIRNWKISDFGFLYDFLIE